MLTLLAQLNLLHSCGSIMAEKLDPNDLVTLKELAISTMWETSALVELLERKGILTRKEVLAMIQELRQREPTAACARGLRITPEAVSARVPAVIQLHVPSRCYYPTTKLGKTRPARVELSSSGEPFLNRFADCEVPR